MSSARPESRPGESAGNCSQASLALSWGSVTNGFMALGMGTSFRVGDGDPAQEPDYLGVPLGCLCLHPWGMGTVSYRGLPGAPSTVFSLLCC